MIDATPRHVLQHRRLSHVAVMTAMITLSLSEASLLQPGVTLAMAVVPLGYLFGVLAGGIASWYLAERRGRAVFGPRTSLALVLGVVGFVGLEYLLSPAGDWIVALAHFLILVQLVKLFGRKTRHDYWQMYLISLVHICVASVVTSDFVFAVGLTVYSGVMLWALILFHFRGHLATCAPAGDSNGDGQGTGMPAVLSRRFVVIVFVVLVCFWVGNVLFFLFSPRLKRPLVSFAHSALSRVTLSGYGGDMRLGGLGQILENTAPVMHVTLTRDGTTYEGLDAPELEWRGTTLQYYDGQTWRESDGSSKSLSKAKPRNIPMRNTFPTREDVVVTQSILLQPTGQPALFALAKMAHLDSGHLGKCGYRNVDGTIRLIRPAVQPLRYEVKSILKGPSFHTVGLNEYTRLPDDLRGSYLQLPERVSTKVRDFARQVTSAARATASADKARVIEDYLRANLTYTLEMEASPGVEPIEHFLFTRKKGHCEYFAASMVVLLRSVDVPARVVTGFKGAQWNDIGKWYVVRHSDAHAWVEAWMGKKGWVSYDPTPPGQRSRAQSANAFTWLARWKDYLYSRWMLNVYQYDRQQQEQVYKQANSLTAKMRRYVTKFGVWVRQLTRKVRAAIFDPAFLTSAYGIVILVVTLVTSAVLGVVIYFAGRWTLRRLGARWRRRRRSSASSTWFYVEMLKLLRRRGLRRSPAVTPHEFARMAVEKLGPRTAGPVLGITETFCQLRYGGRGLADRDRLDLRQELDELRVLVASRTH